MRYLSIVVFMVLFSCNGQKKAAGDGGKGADEVPKTLTLLLRDNYSGLDTVATLVIKDKKAFQKFFSRVNKTRKPGLQVPEVDFSKEMVLIHCSGYGPIGEQDSLFVANENELELQLKSMVVKREKQHTSAVKVSPFSVYKLPLTTKRIVFDKGRQNK